MNETEQVEFEKQVLYIQEKMSDYLKLYKKHLLNLKRNDFSSNESLKDSICDTMDIYTGTINEYTKEIAPEGATYFVLQGRLKENYKQFHNLRDEYMDKLLS